MKVYILIWEGFLGLHLVALSVYVYVPLFWLSFYVFASVMGLTIVAFSMPFFKFFLSFSSLIFLTCSLFYLPLSIFFMGFSPIYTLMASRLALISIYKIFFLIFPELCQLSFHSLPFSIILFNNWSNFDLSYYEIEGIAWSDFFPAISSLCAGLQIITHFREYFSVNWITIISSIFYFPFWKKKL